MEPTDRVGGLAVEEHISLCEALDRVLNKGVVLHGDIVISVAGVDLVYVGLRALLASADTAIRTGALPCERDFIDRLVEVPHE